jgi:hypothetical protein
MVAQKYREAPQMSKTRSASAISGSVNSHKVVSLFWNILYLRHAQRVIHFRELKVGFDLFGVSAISAASSKQAERIMASRNVFYHRTTVTQRDIVQ